MIDEIRNSQAFSSAAARAASRPDAGGFGLALDQALDRKDPTGEARADQPAAATPRENSQRIDEARPEDRLTAERQGQRRRLEQRGENRPRAQEERREQASTAAQGPGSARSVSEPQRKSPTEPRAEHPDRQSDTDEPKPASERTSDDTALAKASVDEAPPAGTRGASTKPDQDDQVGGQDCAHDPGAASVAATTPLPVALPWAARPAAQASVPSADDGQAIATAQAPAGAPAAQAAASQAAAMASVQGTPESDTLALAGFAPNRPTTSASRAGTPPMTPSSEREAITSETPDPTGSSAELAGAASLRTQRGGAEKTAAGLSGRPADAARSAASDQGAPAIIELRSAGRGGETATLESSAPRSQAAQLLESIHEMRGASTGALVSDTRPADTSSFASALAMAATGTAATSDTAAPAPTLRLDNPWPVQDPAFADHLAGQVGEALLAGIERAEITVTPRDMGPIRIELSLSGENANVAFSAAQPETRTAIEQSLPILRTMLADHGLMLSQASVGGSGAEGSGRQAAQGQAAFAPPNGSAGPADGRRGGESSIPSVSRTRQGLLDLFA